MPLKGDKQQHEEGDACPGSLLPFPTPACMCRRSPCLGRHPRLVSVFCPLLERKQGLVRLPLPAGLPLVPDEGTVERNAAPSQGLTTGKASETNYLWRRAAKPGRGPAVLQFKQQSQSQNNMFLFPPLGGSCPFTPPFTFSLLTSVSQPCI